MFKSKTGDVLKMMERQKYVISEIERLDEFIKSYTDKNDFGSAYTNYNLEKRRFEDELKGILESQNEEIKWLENQINIINNEIQIAIASNTNNGRQSVIIYNLFLTQNRFRIKEIQE